jgi:hypothetical protein
MKRFVIIGVSVLVLCGSEFTSVGVAQSINPSVTVSSWAAAVSGSWSNAGNWTGAVPNGIATGAVINASTTAALTVTLDAPQTVGSLVLGNSGSAAVGYTLSGVGSNSLTMDDAGAGATITVTNGAHAIMLRPGICEAQKLS